MTITNTFPRPYVITDEINTVARLKFLGYMADMSYSWMTNLTQEVSEGRRDALGNGIWIRQHSFVGTTFQLYDDIIKETGTSPIIYNEGDYVDVFYKYDAALVRHEKLSRIVEMTADNVSEIEFQSSKLAKSIIRRTEATVLDEIVRSALNSQVGDTASDETATQIYYQDSDSGGTKIGKRGSNTPIYVPPSDDTLPTAAADKYLSSLRISLSKFQRSNQIKSNADNIRRQINFDNTFFNVYIDSRVALFCSNATPNVYGNGENEWGTKLAKGNIIDGTIIFYTAEGQPVRVVKELSLAINSRLNELYDDNLPDRQRLILNDGSARYPNSLDGNFEPILMIVPKGEVYHDVKYIDNIQTKTRIVGTNEMGLFVSFRILAKSKNALYKNTTGTDGITSATKIANSPLVGIWSNSVKPTSSSVSLYQRFKEIFPFVPLYKETINELNKSIVNSKINGKTK